MTAETLREAARVLRERAEKESLWPCADYIRSGIRHLQRNCEIDCDHSEWDEGSQSYVEHECPSPDGSWDRYTTATYIATVHPGVGLAISAVLDAMTLTQHKAGLSGCRLCTMKRPNGHGPCPACLVEDVARAILGESA